MKHYQSHHPEQITKTGEPEDFIVDGCMMADLRPWWKIKIARLFQWHSPTPDLPEWAKDGIVIQIETKFSIIDRIKLLFTGRLSVRAFVACENPPGRTGTEASVLVQPPESCGDGVPW